MARRRVAPVRARRKDERRYIALIRREVVEPRFAAYRAALAGVTGPDDLSRIETVDHTADVPAVPAITDYFVRAGGLPLGQDGGHLLGCAARGRAARSCWVVPASSSTT